MLDSHQHFWLYNPIRDHWITDEMAAIKRDFMPSDILPIMSANGINFCIAVQADQSEVETMYLIELSQKNQFIKGVVGWVDFQNQNIRERLTYFSKFKIIKGWRHILEAEDKSFMLNEKFLAGIRLLKEFDYTYDILVNHNQLAEVIKLVDQFPTQYFVIDHCGKPAIKDKDILNWKNHIQQLAARPNVYCKVSGLLTEADWKQWNEQQVCSYLDIIFECFGTDRLMFGSDWPVINLASNYKTWKDLVQLYVKQLYPSAEKKIFSENASRFYKL